jgi:hypothetical protein
MGKRGDRWFLVLLILLMLALGTWIVVRTYYEPLPLGSTIQIISLIILAAITAWYAYETRRMSRSSQEAANAASKQAIATQRLLGQRYFAQLVGVVIDPLRVIIRRAKETLETRDFPWPSLSLERALEISDKDDVSLFEQTDSGRTLYSIPFPQLQTLSSVSELPIWRGHIPEINRRRASLVNSLREFDKETRHLGQELARLAVIIGRLLQQNWKPVMLVGGYEDPNFITDKQRKVAIVSNPYVMFAEYKLSRAEDVSRALDYAQRENKSLVVVAERVEDEALGTLVLKKLRSEVSCLAVRSRGSADEWRKILGNIASITGGTVLNRESQLAPGSITIQELGRAHRIVAMEYATLVEVSGVEEASLFPERTLQFPYQNSLRREVARVVFLSLMLEKSKFERFLQAQDQTIVLAYWACEHTIKRVVMDRDVMRKLDTVTNHCQSLTEALSVLDSELSGLRDEVVDDYQLDEPMISELKEKHFESSDTWEAPG